MIELRYGTISNGDRTYNDPQAFFLVKMEKKQEVVRETGVDLAMRPYEIIKGTKTIYSITLGASSWYGTTERYYLLNFERAPVKQIKFDGVWTDVFLRKPLEWAEEEGIKFCKIEVETL